MCMAHLSAENKEWKNKKMGLGSILKLNSSKNKAIPFRAISICPKMKNLQKLRIPFTGKIIKTLRYLPQIGIALAVNDSLILRQVRPHEIFDYF